MERLSEVEGQESFRKRRLFEPPRLKTPKIRSPKLPKVRVPDPIGKTGKSMMRTFWTVFGLGALLIIGIVVILAFTATRITKHTTATARYMAPHAERVALAGIPVAGDAFKAQQQASVEQTKAAAAAAKDVAPLAMML